MVFSSYIFIAVFLPLVLIGYYLLSGLKNNLWQKLFLIAASLFFYGYYNVSYLLLIAASTIVNYVLALVIQRSLSEKRNITAKLVLTAGILFNVLLIGYFKYYDFFIDNINKLFGTGFVLKNIVLPLGISFFTFQQLSFLLSIYKRKKRLRRCAITACL